MGKNILVKQEEHSDTVSVNQPQSLLSSLNLEGNSNKDMRFPVIQWLVN